MPELPEVEILVRHLRPRLIERTIKGASVGKPRVTRPESPVEFSAALAGCSILDVQRRAKFLLFTLKPRDRKQPERVLIGHLGMTGRMFVQPMNDPLPPHTAMDWVLDQGRFVFVDPRTFGRFTNDTALLQSLGPEPLSADFSSSYLRDRCAQSKSPIKPFLMDQEIVAGVGNIYASEALFRAGVSPLMRSCELKPDQVDRVRSAIVKTLEEAIELGVKLSLDFAGRADSSGLFYFGEKEGAPQLYEERFRVYDRAGEPCKVCRTPIQRTVQAQRSTFYCSKCQASKRRTTSPS